jgi:hypothetical protein
MPASTSHPIVLCRGADCDVLVCAWGRGFLCVECSLARHPGSSLLCTRAEEMREHLALHWAKGHRVPRGAIEVVDATATALLTAQGAP